MYIKFLIIRYPANLYGASYNFNLLVYNICKNMAKIIVHFICHIFLVKSMNDSCNPINTYAFDHEVIDFLWHPYYLFVVQV